MSIVAANTVALIVLTPLSCLSSVLALQALEKVDSWLRSRIEKPPSARRTG